MLGEMKVRPSRQSGVALIMVIFIVTLASTLVVSLAYSTYLNSRVSAGAQRSIQAEYLLKSTLSLAQVLIDVANPNYDSPKDLWAQFYDGQPIPTEYLGINDPNLRLSLEIRPADAALCVKNLVDGGSGNRTWFNIFTRFFSLKNFDNDTAETDTSGFFPKTHFPSEDLAAALIDYQDNDQTSYQDGGRESDLPKDSLANKYITSFTELSRVPGMTPFRISQILPQITIYGGTEINANFASGVKNLEVDVLKSLDPKINDSTVQEMHDIALSDKPYTSGTDPRLQGILTSSSARDVSLTARSSYFHVIAEADYGTSHFFLRAVLFRDNNASPLPQIKSLEIF